MNKPFDAVRWMRRRREEADEEIRRLGWEEHSRKVLDRLQNDLLWQRLKDRQLPALSDVAQPAPGGKD
jgi:hypothetical protein